MATIGEVKSGEIKITSWKSQRTTSVEKLQVKNIFFNTQEPVIINPIDPKRISKEPTDSLTKSSLVKGNQQ
jgi:hypothetical protein